MIKLPKICLNFWFQETFLVAVLMKSQKMGNSALYLLLGRVRSGKNLVSGQFLIIVVGFQRSDGASIVSRTFKVLTKSIQMIRHRTKLSQAVPYA